MKPTLNTESLCAIGLIIGFFLPWATVDGLFPVSVAGYEIPDIAKKTGQFMTMASRSGNQAYLLNLLYLIPATSALTIFLNMQGKDTRLSSAVAGGIPIVGFLYGLLKVGGIPRETLSFLDFGAWLTLVAAVVMLLAVMGAFDAPPANKAGE